ncbi:hypothetical protein JTB14_032587 [Gonioctena quinquepunctata]|nr:hypothetical protein JTB14_032587 [Gonioctena quinquepunctata]
MARNTPLTEAQLLACIDVLLDIEDFDNAGDFEDDEWQNNENASDVSLSKDENHEGTEQMNTSNDAEIDATPILPTLDTVKAGTNKLFQTKVRGTSEELISDDGEVILTEWFDNKAVTMASNYMGIGGTDRCRRAHVGEALILSSTSRPKKRGRPSAVSDEGPQTPKSQPRPRSELRPIDDVRFDGINHLPELDDKNFASRCKSENCSGGPRTKCSKCEVRFVRFSFPDYAGKQGEEKCQNI